MPKKIGGGNKLQEYKKKDGEYTFNDGGETTTELSNRLKQEIKSEKYKKIDKTIKNDHIRNSIEVNHIPYQTVNKLNKSLTLKNVKERFKVKKSHSLYGKKYKRDSILIECDSLINNSDFINMLPYINNQKRR